LKPARHRFPSIPPPIPPVFVLAHEFSLASLFAVDGLDRARWTFSALGAARRAALQRQSIATAASLAAATGLTPATVNKSLAHLERIRVVAQLTRKQRGRVFSYARYADILNEGMEVPAGASVGHTVLW
jgi:hypothetical protein